MPRSRGQSAGWPLLRSGPVVLSLLAVCAVWVGSCDEAQRHRTLSYLFDGVPPLGGTDSADPNLAGGDGRSGRIYAPWVVHEPAKSRADCPRCHGDQRQRDFSREVQLTAPVPQLCYECHEELLTMKGWVHGPVAAGECTTLCHEPHRTPNPYLLKRPIPDICYQCHDRQAISQIEDHTKDGYARCGVCHEGHSSSATYLLRVSVSDANDSPAPIEPANRDQFEEFLVQARTDVRSGKPLADLFETVGRYVEEGKLWQARAYLAGVRNAAAFTSDQLEQIDELLRKIEQAEVTTVREREQQQAQNERAVAELYRRSIELYRSGRLEQAKEGLVEVLGSEFTPAVIKKAIQEYIVEIDRALAGRDPNP